MIYLLNSDARQIPLADKSVQCVVTSPPYWGLRDYGISDQIGLESTPAAYVAHIVAVMRECWRVLKDDGVLWLNLGDSYNNSSDWKPHTGEAASRSARQYHNDDTMKKRMLSPGLKPKDLCGIPWRVAFALQEDGWYLRSDVIEKVELYCPCGCGYVLEEKIWRYSQDREIIWNKPNPMPESVTDRPTKAHEYVFILTKRERYYYDAEAIKEPQTYNGSRGWITSPNRGDETGRNDGGRKEWNDDGKRNRRSVWTVAAQPYSGSHFAVFPMALIEPMILAGTSARGECPHCGKAWVRVVEKGEPILNAWSEKGAADSLGNPVTEKSTLKHIPNISTLGWRQQCACPPHEPIPQTVLDPFAGSGTTGAVAVKHGRRAVLLDLNTKYIDLQFDRTSKVQITMQM